MTTNRSDTHKPSLLDPAEYEFVAAFYQGSSNDMAWSYRDEHAIYTEAVEGNESGTPGKVFQGNYASKLTCDHCGAAFAHGVLFKHLPTGELIHVGHICASNTVGLPSRAAAVRKSAERAAADEKARLARHEANAEWQAANADIIEFLNALDAERAAYHEAMEQANETGSDIPKPIRLHNFLSDMIHTFNRYGNLSEKQAAATRKFMAAAKERAENPKPVEPEPTTPLEDGRREITGIVVHTKWSEDRGYGSQPKMVVKQADGNKVFGTVPEAAFTAERTSLDQLKGMEVSFKATVERSNDDEHFGFYKRPTNLTVKEVTA